MCFTKCDGNIRGLKICTMKKKGYFPSIVSVSQTKFIPIPHTTNPFHFVCHIFLFFSSLFGLNLDVMRAAWFIYFNHDKIGVHKTKLMHKQTTSLYKKWCDTRVQSQANVMPTSRQTKWKRKREKWTTKSIYRICKQNWVCTNEWLRKIAIPYHMRILSSSITRWSDGQIEIMRFPNGGKCDVCARFVHNL